MHPNSPVVHAIEGLEWCHRLMSDGRKQFVVEAIHAAIDRDAELGLLAQPDDRGTDSLLSMIPESDAAMLEGRILREEGLHRLGGIVGFKLRGEESGAFLTIGIVAEQ